MSQLSSAPSDTTSLDRIPGFIQILNSTHSTVSSGQLELPLALRKECHWQSDGKLKLPIRRLQELLWSEGVGFLQTVRDKEKNCLCVLRNPKPTLTKPSVQLGHLQGDEYLKDTLSMEYFTGFREFPIIRFVTHPKPPKRALDHASLSSVSSALLGSTFSLPSINTPTSASVPLPREEEDNEGNEDGKDGKDDGRGDVVETHEPKQAPVALSGSAAGSSSMTNGSEFAQALRFAHILELSAKVMDLKCSYTCAYFEQEGFFSSLAAFRCTETQYLQMATTAVQMGSLRGRGPPEYGFIEKLQQLGSMWLAASEQDCDGLRHKSLREENLTYIMQYLSWK
ncbi:hypothetical protein FS749_002580 [Ceratobasidium sp. UAMH 11750]|nr:hypothetical protein FS749_002580 [Ceratobasidium sp. UAMH 11750]